MEEEPISAAKSAENENPTDLNDDDSIENAEPYQEEGKRMKLLRNALETTTDKFLSSIKYPLFSRNYKDLHVKHRVALESTVSNFQRVLKEKVMSEMEVMFEEENMVDLMNEMEEIVSNTPLDTGDFVWRPSGDPSEDVRAHVMQIKLKQKEKLEQLLVELEHESRDLEAAVKQRRRLVSDKHAKVSAKMNTLKENLEVSGQAVEDVKSFLEKV